MTSFYEFFCGGGMARAGLGNDWECLFANDFDPKKLSSYKENWGDRTIHEGDVRTVDTQDLSNRADLLWASFPCQDLSLAGQGLGLNGSRSSTISEIWRIVSRLNSESRAPTTIVFENVCGLISSRRGADFRSVVQSFVDHEYNVGAVVIDALDFLPQSRKRIFFIGTKKGVLTSAFTEDDEDTNRFVPKNLQLAINGLPEELKPSWRHWTLPTPPKRQIALSDILENSSDLVWHPSAYTSRLLSQMNALNERKVADASALCLPQYGTVFRRTRVEDNIRVVRAEVRFDGIAGCLRTPNGGSSKQILIEVNGNQVRSRHLTGRECSRLMGLPDGYKIPQNHNQALHLTGDGVAVPVVNFLSEHLLLPLVNSVRNSACDNDQMILTAA